MIEFGNLLRTPARKKINKDELIILSRKLQRFFIQTDRIFSILVQLFQRIRHFDIMEFDIVLQHVAMHKALCNPIGIHRPLVHVLGDILSFPQQGHDINRRILAREIHHGDVEMNPNVFFLVAIQGKIRYQVIFEKSLGFPEKQGNDGEDGDQRHDASLSGTFQ